MLNPGQAMLTLCERFLDQHQGQERMYLLDQIAEQINNQPGWDAPYPTGARDLASRTYDLLLSSGKKEQALQHLAQMSEFDMTGETLESLAADQAD